MQKIKKQGILVFLILCKLLCSANRELLIIDEKTTNKNKFPKSLTVSNYDELKIYISDFLKDFIKRDAAFSSCKTITDSDILPRWDHVGVLDEIKSDGFYTVEPENIQKFFSTKVKVNVLNYVIVLQVPDYSVEQTSKVYINIFNIEAKKNVQGQTIRYFIKSIFTRPLQINLGVQDLSSQLNHLKIYFENCLCAKKITKVSIDDFKGLADSYDQLRSNITDSLFFSPLGKKYEFFKKENSVNQYQGIIRGDFEIANASSFAGRATFYLIGFADNSITITSTWQNESQATRKILKSIFQKIINLNP